MVILGEIPSLLLFPPFLRHHVTHFLNARQHKLIDWSTRAPSTQRHATQNRREPSKAAGGHENLSDLLAWRTAPLVPTKPHPNCCLSAARVHANSVHGCFKPKNNGKTTQTSGLTNLFLGKASFSLIYSTSWFIFCFFLVVSGFTRFWMVPFFWQFQIKSVFHLYSNDRASKGSGH